MCTGNNTDFKVRAASSKVGNAPRVAGVDVSVDPNMKNDIPEPFLPPQPEAPKEVNPDLEEFQRTFIEKALPAATKVANALKVPTNAVLAQLALESGWGKSTLAKKYNNFGGIKTGSSWKGKKVSLPTYEKNRSQKINADFRAYESPEEYGDDMVRILSYSRYKDVPGAEDAYEYALRLGKAGYHQDTPEEYAKTVAKIAETIGVI